MLSYNDKTLVKFRDKTGGKNDGKADGFYRNDSGEKFFIKKPKEQTELFTELFAGLLLNEFKKRELIEPYYFDSLICAEPIKFEDGSYGLIQPLIPFTELYKIIGTGKLDGSDRDPFLEMIAGPSYYPLLAKQGKYFGLSMSLMFSLLLGDYSVHSGNVVVLNESAASTPENVVKQFGRIDWGAAFRHYAKDSNNENILNPTEYQGWLNYKGYTKGYIHNYKNILGLFSAVSDKARELADKLGKDELLEIVISAVQQIPVDLLDAATKSELAKYMGIDAFATATFGPEGDCLKFIDKFVETLALRLDKISNLEEEALLIENNPESEQSFGYRSILLPKPKPLEFIVNAGISFPEQMQNWQEALSKRLTGDFTKLDLAELAQHFNYYLGLLAHQAEAFDLWDHQPDNNQNMFVAYADKTTSFIRQYRESVLLQRLYSVDLSTLKKSSFAPYDELDALYSENYPESSWVHVTRVLKDSHEIIEILGQIKMLPKEGDIKPLLEKLQGKLGHFVNRHNELMNYLSTNINPSIGNNSDFQSAVYYPISEEELTEMTDEQLATIYLQEQETDCLSSLTACLIKNDELYGRVIKSLVTIDPSKAGEFISYRASYQVFEDNKTQFNEKKNPSEKIQLFNKLEGSFEKLPQFLQTELHIVINEARARLEKEAEEEHREVFFKESELKFLRSGTINEKINANEVLQQNYNNLPEHLKIKYKDVAERYANETHYIKCHQGLLNTETIAVRRANFPILAIAYNALPEDLKEKHRDSYEQLHTNELAYRKLLAGKCIEPETKITDVAPTLTLLQTVKGKSEEAIKEAALSDKWLWQALVNMKKDNLTGGLIKDLLLLKNFYETKIALNENSQFGNEYNQSLENFYQGVLTSRLSEKPLKAQVTEMIDIAHREFQPRHSLRRALADFMMIASLIGLVVVGGSRKAMGKTLFFSTAITDRESDFRQNWLKLPTEVEEEEEESSLLDIMAATSA